MLATTKIIRLFAKKGEIQTIPAKNVLPFFRIGSWALHMRVVAVLWCQPIKLIHVVSTSEFHEYGRNDVDFIFLSPPFSAGPQK